MTPDGGAAQSRVLKSVRLPLALTRLGMFAERILRAFWPLISVMMITLALLMLGLQDIAPVEVVWASGVVALLASLAALVIGARRFSFPTHDEALDRLDATMRGRPLRALLDQQVIGKGDASSAAVWQAHQARMAERAAKAEAVRPDLRLSRRDPFALRYVALLTFCVALIFGSLLRVGSVSEMAPGSASAAAAGPSWEGWVEPPRYTGKPTLYLNDQPEGLLSVPEGSRIMLRFYGQVGALTLAETVSGRTGDIPPASDPVHDFSVTKNGDIRIDGEGGRMWSIALIADSAPEIEVAGEAEAAATGAMTLPFTARDDYEVMGGEALIALDLGSVDRRYGLVIDPEPRPAVTVPLPLPIAGDRNDFTESLIEDFSKHPWANLPVRITLKVTDAAGQDSAPEILTTPLPARRFFDPMAAAVIEQRRDLLWSRQNGPRIAQVVRAISNKPEGLFRSETAYLRLRVILRRLEMFNEHGMTSQQQDELAEALWELAIQLEEGDLGDALERMRRAQERLSEAMRNGATDQEIAELMQELREATDDYIRQLSRQAQQEQQDGEEGQQQLSENSIQMGQDDLQRMMDRIQELMEQGRMAEAQQALQELQQMMENMRITQGQGQGGQSEGQRAMEGLADTLRQQQGLSDEAFRDLQEQFNPGAQAGENQGNRGRNGGQGEGQSHEGQQGQGQGDGTEPGEGNRRAGEGEDGLERSLADRQQALRDELRRQEGNLPGGGTPEGDAAREALDRAGRAMDGAEDALRQEDFAGAIDRQSEAMEALREGMRSLGEAMAQEQQGQPGQGQQAGDMNATGRDPLGRNSGSNGRAGTEESLLQGEDVYRRARELLDEIRRRSGEGERPDVELDYLRRLLERF